MTWFHGLQTWNIWVIVWSTHGSLFEEKYSYNSQIYLDDPNQPPKKEVLLPVCIVLAIVEIARRNMRENIMIYRARWGLEASCLEVFLWDQWEIAPWFFTFYTMGYFYTFYFLWVILWYFLLCIAREIISIKPPFKDIIFFGFTFSRHLFL